MVSGAKAAWSVEVVQCSCRAVSAGENVGKLGEEMLKWFASLQWML